MWWNEETDILDIIGAAKERLLDAERFTGQIDADDEVLKDAVDFFRVYEKALRSAGAIDFADMVPLVVRAMDQNRDYAASITGAYDHVLVDEYQDVNPGQVRLLDHFVNGHDRMLFPMVHLPEVGHQTAVVRQWCIMYVDTPESGGA